MLQRKFMAVAINERIGDQWRERNIQSRLIGNDELSKRTVASEGTNAISDSELGNLGANSNDDSRVIRTRDERKRKFLLVFSKNLKVIGVIQTCSFNLNSDRRRRIQRRNRMVFTQHYWRILIAER